MKTIKRRMTASTRRAIASFSRIQNMPVRGVQVINGKMYPALYAPHTVSRYTIHEQAIREHVARGNAMPQPYAGASAPEIQPIILDDANVIGGGFVPLSDVTPQ